MALTQGSRGVERGRAQADVTSGRTDVDVSQREDLSNFISMITRDETPFMSSIGKTKANQIRHEWQTDALESPGNSRIAEGKDYVDVVTPNTEIANESGPEFNIVGPFRTRLSNVCQINGKTITVSGTRRAIDQAGVADEYAYQLKKRGTEMRRDIEQDLVGTPNVAVSGNAIRSMGTLRSWLSPGAATVISNGVTDLDAANQGNGTNVAANHGSSTKVALSLSDIDAVMQSIYEEGGKATRIMVSPKLRRDFSDLMVTDSGVRRNLDEKGKLRQSVDVYMSDFGDLMVIPNYIMGLDAGSGNSALADEAAFIYDTSWFAMATLRPLQEVQVGQKGDSTVGMFVEELSFEVKNPLGSGAIYGLE